MKIMKIQNVARLCFALFFTLGIAVMVGCEDKTANSNTTAGGTPTTASTTPPTASAPSTPGGTAPSRPSKSGATGTLSVSPNPVKVCDGSGVGITEVSWTFSGAQRVEVRIGSPDGGVFAMAEAPGSQRTGKWVGNGTVFYLQDVSKGLAPIADHTIATATANVTAQGCP